MPMTTDIAGYISGNISTWILPANGTVPTGNIFESFLPDLPDRAVGVFQLPGSKPQRTLGKNFAYQNMRLRIINRVPVGTAGSPGTGGYALAYSDAQAIWDLLKAVSNQTVNGVKYMLIDPEGQPAPQELDPNNRPWYSQEFSVMKYMSD